MVKRFLIWLLRVVTGLSGPAILYGWYYFAPDYSAFIHRSIFQVTSSDFRWHVFWILILPPVFVFAFSRVIDGLSAEVFGRHLPK